MKEMKPVKRCIYRSKKEVSDQFGRKMNRDTSGNRKFFWKEMGKGKDGKVKSCSRVNAGNEMVEVGKDEVRRTWKNFENLHNMDLKSKLLSI